MQPYVEMCLVSKYVQCFLWNSGILRNERTKIERCAFSLATAWCESKNSVLARKSFGLTGAFEAVTTALTQFNKIDSKGIAVLYKCFQTLFLIDKSVAMKITCLKMS